MAWTDTTALADTVTAAYDLVANFALRPQFYYHNLATVKPTRQSHRGSTVSFPFYGELAAQTSALTETSDVTPLAMSDTLVVLTLLEYGAAVETTAAVRGEDFLEVDMDAANLIGHNAGLSVDTLARDVLEADTTNVIFVGQASEAAITATDILDATSIRTSVASLRGGDASPIMGSNYVGFIHPDVSLDLREEVAVGDFAYAASNVGDGGRIWNGFVGTFGGVGFLESSRPSINADGGASTVDTYTTTIIGKEAMAMTFARNVSGAVPGVVLGPVTDYLRRFRSVGWYWLGDHGVFRGAAIANILSASSIGAN